MTVAVYFLCRDGKETQKDEDLSELVKKLIGIVRGQGLAPDT